MGRILLQAVIVPLVGFVLGPWNWAAAGLLLQNDPPYSPFRLELSKYLQMPAGSSNIISMTTRLGDHALYVTTQEGHVHRVVSDASGTGIRTAFLDLADTNAGGVTMTGDFGQQGLQSIAFHPDFDRMGEPGYGKLYASLLRTADSIPFDSGYLGSISGPTAPVDSVLAEWTFHHATGTVGGYRELFRVKMAVNDHPIKQARFNPYAKPGDEDYGLLYLSHGDSNLLHSPGDFPQLLSNALGKMVRIDPIDPDGFGDLQYKIPATNPFAGSTDAEVLPEIYAYGFRNPHNYSFNRDDEGIVHIVASDIGRNNIEEVNLVTAGENYGWPKREGTFVHRQLTNSDPEEGYITGVADLPVDEATLNYRYPAAQYDHNAEVGQMSSGSAIASGFVFRNGSDPNLHNQLILNNFGDRDGVVYHADFGDLLGAVVRLDPNDSERDEPGELTQAGLNKLRLALDHDSNPETESVEYDDFSLLIGKPRNDARYGEGVFGEMHISTKQNGGEIYLATNSVPLAGDYNKDRVVDAADYAAWRAAFGTTSYHVVADGNGDGNVDAADYTVWQDNFGREWPATGRTNIRPLAIAIPEPRTALVAWCGAIGWTISYSAFRPRNRSARPPSRRAPQSALTSAAHCCLKAWARTCSRRRQFATNHYPPRVTINTAGPR